MSIFIFIFYSGPSFTQVTGYQPAGFQGQHAFLAPGQGQGQPCLQVYRVYFFLIFPFSDLLFFPSTSFRFPISFFPIYSFLLFLSSYFLFPIFYSFFRFPIPILYYFLLVKGLKCESDMTHDLLCVYI